MIIAIEGIDKSGKTTLFKEVRKHLAGDYVYVPNYPTTPEIMACVQAYEDKELSIWEALHDWNRIYICDRHLLVTNRVYSEYYGRPQYKCTALSEALRVVHIKAKPETLADREQDWLRQDHSAVAAIYDRVVGEYPNIVLAAEDPVEANVKLAALAIRRWRSNG